MNKFQTAIEQICEEKGIPKEIVLETVEAALAAAYKKDYGHKDQERMPGSIGAGGVQHVRKGTRMAGRMGGDAVTVKNLEVVAIDAEKGLLALSGAIPGARGGLLLILGK